MRIAPISNTNFGKFYIQQEDYSSAQSVYLNDISTKLNRKNGSFGSYAERLENLGYDIWATSGSRNPDEVRVLLTKHNQKATDEPNKGMISAIVGEYTTDFNPEIAVNAAESDKKMNKLLSELLLGVGAILAIAALIRGCSDTSSAGKALSKVTEQTSSFFKNTANSAKALKI